MNIFECPYPRRSPEGLVSWGDFRDIENNLYMIRRGLATGAVIEFHCYNLQEVTETKVRLTDSERKKVRFFWMTWPRLERPTHTPESGEGAK